MEYGGVAKPCHFWAPQEEIPMWYVVQVQTGTEEKIRTQCISIIDGEILERCFIPYYEEKKKYQGAWHTEKRILFPGYVFMVSERLADLYKGLWKVIGLTKLLGTGKEIVPLSEEETALLERMGAGERPLEISTGFIEKGEVRVTEGPLVGLEGCIRKIDRHKRKAWLEIDMFGRMIEMEVGLEIIEKK